MTLVDTSVLFDLVTNDTLWFDWSAAQMDAASRRGRLAINPVIYAELSVRHPTVASVEAFVSAAGLELLEVPRTALFLAGKAFVRYRRAGGVKTGVLSDFFIGAHAAALDMPLLTRDPCRVQTYFPDLTLIAP